MKIGSVVTTGAIVLASVLAGWAVGDLLPKGNGGGAAKADLEAAQAETRLVTAEYDLKKTLIHAPIAGQIGKTAAHVGDYVSPSKGALAHIVQLDPIRVTFPVTDRAYVAWRTAKSQGKADDVRTRLVLPNGYLTLLSDRKNPEPQPCVPQQALFDLAGGKQGVFVMRDFPFTPSSVSSSSSGSPRRTRS